MRHLTLEEIARLVDEAPGPDEAAHLEGCESCGLELEALRTQTDALAALPKLAPTRDAWPGLRASLRSEGLIVRRERRAWGPGAMRAAAALALFVAGGAAGFMARGVAAPVGSSTASPDAVASVERALEPGQEVERTEERFAAALDRYMRANGTAAPDPAARLAALDNIVLTTAEALNESPTDPIINSYHLTAVAQRNELLRRLAASAGEPVF